MADRELMREFMQTLLTVQISFRQSIQRSLKDNNVDLTFEMLQILVCLWRKDGVNQQDLASQTMKDKSSLSPLISNLEAKKLVVRRSDHVDRRNKNIYLTDLGKEYSKFVNPLLQDIYFISGERMDNDMTVLCMDYLTKLNSALK